MPQITILVEDRQAIQEMLVPALAELSDARVVATTTTAGAAKKALALWTGQWHLIVVDLFLAEGSGLEVLEAIKLRQKDQYAVVLSNYAIGEMRRRCKELGADYVFDKSTELDEFFELCSALPHPRPSQHDFKTL